MTMSADRFHQAYLVRLWAIHHNGELRWRAAIEAVHTGARHAFADLPSLCRFLEAATAECDATVPAETGAADVQSICS